MIDFPRRRDAVQGSWSPIYLEPIVGSGERICIGVAALNGSASLVVPVVALDRLECLYGKNVDAILLASRVALEYTRGALGMHGASGLRSWKAPMDGLYLGDSVQCEGDTLEEIARTGLTAASSLVEKLADSDCLYRCGMKQEATMSDQDEALRLADAVAYLQGSLRHGDDEESCSACARYRELIGAAIAMKAENERLRAECDALRADAERYRLLRRGLRWSFVNGIGDMLRADELDAAIDAAREAK